MKKHQFLIEVEASDDLDSAEVGAILARLIDSGREDAENTAADSGWSEETLRIAQQAVDCTLTSPKTFESWELEFDSDDPQYLLIRRDGRPGEIRIKADDEGYVVDVWPDDYEEADATLFAFYEDLKTPEDTND